MYLLRIAAKAHTAAVTHELAVSQKLADRQKCKTLLDDWNSARNRMWTELVVKLAYWQQLPWKIFQLAHTDPLQVIQGAKQCLALWDLQGSGCLHQQSRRFLSPDWDGGAEDPGLRGLVIRLSKGEPLLGSTDFKPMILWLSRFACVRLAERSVESIHSVITRTYKRAPSAALPYISIELRFREFWESIVRNPAVPWL